MAIVLAIGGICWLRIDASKKIHMVEKPAPVEIAVAA
jgi:hypothetical protein